MAKTVESVVNRFYVYVLRDPRDNSIFYVGCTQNPKSRGLSAKNYGPGAGGRIREIRLAGRLPKRETVGVFGSSEYAAYQEIYAIEALRERGHRLLNHPKASPYAPSYDLRNAPRPTGPTQWEIPKEIL
jgi:hypothetical protein